MEFYYKSIKFWKKFQRGENKADVKIQWAPIYVIVLGPRQTDNINQMNIIREQLPLYFLC